MLRNHGDSMMFVGGTSLGHLFGVNLIEQEFCEMCVLKGGEKDSHQINMSLRSVSQPSLKRT